MEEERERQQERSERIWEKERSYDAINKLGAKKF